ncbi:MAG: antitoxin family protein [Nitrospinae bacterium]|nr:antitoxin family protein [Nitrospinota bacterium]
MPTLVIRAIYEEGKLRPLDPLSLEEQESVLLQVISVRLRYRPPAQLFSREWRLATSKASRLSSSWQRSPTVS